MTDDCKSLYGDKLKLVQLRLGQMQRGILDLLKEHGKAKELLKKGKLREERFGSLCTEVAAFRMNPSPKFNSLSISLDEEARNYHSQRISEMLQQGDSEKENRFKR
ncbi:unnamed protein product [Angiostrongylus costaricensis]|uniref:BAR domain-containing protein n=1 Tax=Angiostrongylus costaricensis TaxID=334426 RepID=A0A0R3PW96_ANGCS|nr:unnamed protein product [Angiostrongylus costaricensis]